MEPRAQGSSGANYTINSTLRPGQTEIGLYSAWGGGSGSYFDTLVNFRLPLRSDLPQVNASFIANSTSDTTNCPGPGHALPGQLCVYEYTNGSRNYLGIFNPLNGKYGVSEWGFSIYFDATAVTAWS